jgi:hypothetical protein
VIKKSVGLTESTISSKLRIRWRRASNRSKRVRMRARLRGIGRLKRYSIWINKVFTTSVGGLDRLQGTV